MNLETLDFSSLVSYRDETLKEIEEVKNYIAVLDDLGEKRLVSDYKLKKNFLTETLSRLEDFLYCVHFEIKQRISFNAMGRNREMYDMVTNSISDDLKRYKNGLHKRV